MLRNFVALLHLSASRLGTRFSRARIVFITDLLSIVINLDGSFQVEVDWVRVTTWSRAFIAHWQ